VSQWVVADADAPEGRALLREAMLRLLEPGCVGRISLMVNPATSSDAPSLTTRLVCPSPPLRPCWTHADRFIFNLWTEDDTHHDATVLYGTAHYACVDVTRF
jgi:hypothetical protein